MGDINYSPPVQVEEVFHLEVEGHGAKGDPFGRLLNYVIFINLDPGTKLDVGEKVSVKITRVFEKQAFASIVQDSTEF